MGKYLRYIRKVDYNTGFQTYWNTIFITDGKYFSNLFFWVDVMEYFSKMPDHVSTMSLKTGASKYYFSASRGT